jgi:leucyl-tRNA synthetase
MQRNWIGRSNGAEVSFKVEGDFDQQIKVYTTRPDTLSGATFLILAPEHPLVELITTNDQRDAVNSYVRQAEIRSDIERQETQRQKTGVFSGAYGVNPLNQKKIPIWIADYVLMNYGTGAIMAVPAHDQRDHDFAEAFNLPIDEVIKAPEPTETGSLYEGEGILINSGKYNSLNSAEAREKIISDLAAEGAAQATTNYKMRDWLISRQRYWGAPIPIIHCPKDGSVPVPDKDLPVLLPDISDYQPRGDGQSPLANSPEFVKTTCPQCGGPAERETDTMDGFACSSWYFLRFADPHNDQAAFARDKADYWLPVDYYIGGTEHAVMHLLYARFWVKAMYDEGLINFTEPFTRLRNQGMILAPDGSKMGKSQHNTIEPDSLISQGYGADSIRLMELFIGPWDQATNWNTEGLGGTYRFLQRIWILTQEFLAAKPTGAPVETDDGSFATELKRLMHKTIKRVSGDMPDFGFNTAIASLMEAVNELYKLKVKDNYSHRLEWQAALEQLVRLLAPFAPFISEELWQDLGHTESIHKTSWPEWDESLLTENTVTIVVQINGKLRAEVNVSLPTSQDEVVKAASASEKIIPYLKDKTIARVVYVSQKLINFVVK